MTVGNFHQGRAVLALAWLSWAAALAAGFGLIWGYELTRSLAEAAPVEWPAGTQIAFQPGRANLILAAHPHCPCTRASIGELARLMAQAEGRLVAHVLLVRPDGVSENWVDTDLAASAAAIPGVDVRRDDGGREAARFGALSSGHVVVYDGSGRQQFAGGITAARGHAGDNAGSAAVLAVAERGNTEQPETSVFGCPLLDDQPRCPEGTRTCGS
jgi:hypothetical protein